MSRLLSFALLSLCLVAWPPGSLAQPATPATAVVADGDYPGTITLSVDATDVARRLYQVRERIPVRSGLLKLWYPQWIPGNHAATGPINQFAGLVISGNGQRIQ